MLLFYLYLGLHFVYMAQGQFSCYDCPFETNQFNSLIDADSLPTDLNNCSIVTNQYQCAIRLMWIRTTNSTWIALMPGYEFRRRSDADDEGDGPSVKVTLTYKRNARNLVEWTDTLYYTCDSNKCNSPTTLKWLLRSMTVRDNFHELDHLVRSNPSFAGSKCFFFANTSYPCETEMNQTNCRQCAWEQTDQGGATSVCANCVEDEDVENFITREVKFPINEKGSDDFTVLQCQVNGCTQPQTVALIPSRSTVNFNPFTPNRSASMNISSMLLTVILLLSL